MTHTGDFDAFARRIIDGGDDFDSAVIVHPRRLSWFERARMWLVDVITDGDDRE